MIVSRASTSRRRVDEGVQLVRADSPCEGLRHDACEDARFVDESLPRLLDGDAAESRRDEEEDRAGRSLRSRSR